ncbi:MAG: IS5 family transposase [Pseudomonadota bacterium]|nr:IS5 family transposase [Pseudomonadota bacterium]
MIASDKKYPSDLTDVEWKIIKELMEQEEPYTTGRPAKVDIRRIWDAIFYVGKTGCQWRYLPHDFPPPTTVNYYYRKWTQNGLFEKVNAAVREQLRKENGRNETPSAAIIDTQSVKGTPESAKESGVDGFKNVKGRKRHIIVDTIGCVLAVVMHAANVYDGNGARGVIQKLFEGLDTVKIIWADQTYRGDLGEWVENNFSCKLEVVEKNKQKGFVVQPKRWVVERTFAWLSRFRRLNRDYEREPKSSESMVNVASIRLMLKSLTKSNNFAASAS